MALVTYSQDFISKLKAAYVALTECAVHKDAGPGYKGIREELWQCAGFESEAEFLRTIYPGWPNLNAMKAAASSDE